MYFPSTLPFLISWTKYMSWLMYAVESLSIIQWKGVSNISKSRFLNITTKIVVICHCFIIISACENQQLDLLCLKEGAEVLEKYSFSEEHLVRNIWIMAVLLFGFYAIGYLCLWWKTRNK